MIVGRAEPHRLGQRRRGLLAGLIAIVAVLIGALLNCASTAPLEAGGTAAAFDAQRVFAVVGASNPANPVYTRSAADPNPIDARSAADPVDARSAVSSVRADAPAGCKRGPEPGKPGPATVSASTQRDGIGPALGAVRPADQLAIPLSPPRGSGTPLTQPLPAPHLTTVLLI
ncbi:hypothetical protein JK358_14380 [Nocardia sp. 2]|uniref:Uncharacterized protein n=1 Tax=Nocardia acididurans TaxID=2802282 RepID=A0ABS1M4K2_9NOCA|nr:hypothetical protein [Nocardia acididurans]MBL1075583.1 hypothetical protein [Nocardia acididurans]